MIPAPNSGNSPSSSFYHQIVSVSVSVSIRFISSIHTPLFTTRSRLLHLTGHIPPFRKRSRGPRSKPFILNHPHRLHPIAGRHGPKTLAQTPHLWLHHSRYVVISVLWDLDHDIMQHAEEPGYARHLLCDLYQPWKEPEWMQESRARVQTMVLIVACVQWCRAQ